MAVRTLPADFSLGVRSDLVRSQAPLLEQGYRAEDDWLRGSAGAQSAVRRTVTLEAGVPYAILAVCDVECGDIDLRITDASDSTLATDELPNDTPLLEFTAARSGQYQLELRMFACEPVACTWVGRIYRR
jgi:hypothetical protein